jgi:hypothetical protein
VQGLVNISTNIITNPVESVKSGIACGHVAIAGAYNNVMWLQGILQHESEIRLNSTSTSSSNNSSSENKQYLGVQRV